MTSQFLQGVESFALAAPPFAGGIVAGLFWQQAPPGQLFPYCRYLNVGPALPEYFTDPTQAIDNVRLQFSFFGTNNFLLFDYANQVKNRFKAASIPLSSGIVLACLPSATPYGLGVDPKFKSPDAMPVYHVVMDLMFRVA